VSLLDTRPRVDPEPAEEGGTVEGAGGPPQRFIVGTASLLKAVLGDQTGSVGLSSRVIAGAAYGADALSHL
jgi:hypothetical protein